MNPTLSKRVIASLKSSGEEHQWEQLIGNLLRRLELDPADRARAEADYDKLAERVAEKLSLPRHDVHIFPQGSMRTQTTISQRHPVKFDLDLVVKLMGPKYDSPNPEVMFAAFGRALEGSESVTGAPEEKRRCWRLGFPGKPYYFDLTPAVRDQTGKAGSSLSVRDPDTRWAPSNPEEFADWFCTNANLRFPFQAMLLKSQVEALAPALDQSRQALADAHSGLAGQLAAFEAQVTTLTERAKVQAVKHVLTRTDEASRRSVELQARAMADAARVALGAELGATLQRLQSAAQPRAESPRRRWDLWLTHAAAATTASAVTWTVAVMVWGC